MDRNEDVLIITPPPPSSASSSTTSTSTGVGYHKRSGVSHLRDSRHHLSHHHNHQLLQQQHRSRGGDSGRVIFARTPSHSPQSPREKVKKGSRGSSLGGEEKGHTPTTMDSNDMDSEDGRFFESETNDRRYHDDEDSKGSFEVGNVFVRNGPSFAHSPSHEVFNKVYEIVSECFEDFSPLHEKLYGKPAKMKRTPYPMVLLIGNHSSGKSTFLNWVCRRGTDGGVREIDIQKTGRAPTDDVFTVIVGGPKEQHLDFDNLCRKEEFERLKKVFGTGDRVVPVEMKVVTDCDALGVKDYPRKLAIVDSPGIIGSPVSTNDEAQQYFKRLTRYFADLADVVLLFFDPDKPGTTKEANDVFRECLAHINSVKLHIIFNKVDAFKSLEDFGKAHGTLYWNLSAAMQRKDVPIVHNMFCPTDTDSMLRDLAGPRGVGVGMHASSPLRKGSHAHALRSLLTEEFEQTRKLIEGKVRDAPKRATENTIHLFSDTLLQMHMHGCMLTACGSMYRRTQFTWRGLFWATVAGTSAVVGRLSWVAALDSRRTTSGVGVGRSGRDGGGWGGSTGLSLAKISSSVLNAMDHLLSPTTWISAFDASWRAGLFGAALASVAWLAGSEVLRRTRRKVIENIDDIWTEFGFTIREGVLHRRRDPRSPNLVRSKWHADVDEEVAALWKRTRPQLLGTLEDHYSSLSDVPILTEEDESFIVDMLQHDGSRINKLARS